MQRNCTPLPEEWIEVLTDGVQLPAGEKYNNNNNNSTEAASVYHHYNRNSNNSLNGKRAINRQSLGTNVGGVGGESVGLKRPATGTSRATAVTVGSQNAGKNGHWKIREGLEWEVGGHIRENKEEEISEE